MTSIITIRPIRPIRLAAAAATVGLLTFAGACGTEPSADGSHVEPAAPARVVQQGSPDSIERRLAAQVVAREQGSPDAIERRLAALRAEASCRVSTDSAERLGAKACLR